MRASRDAPAAESMFERSGDSVLSIDCPRIPALAHFLLQSSHLPFQALDSIERLIEAGGVHRLQEGADGREGAAKFPLLWDQLVRCVCHRKLLNRQRAKRQRLESFCPRPKVDFVRPGVSRLREDVDVGLGDCVGIERAVRLTARIRSAR